MKAPIIETFLPFPKRKGKVRDVYDLGETLLVVSTDRISAFDYILPTGIPDKGRILTQLSCFWFRTLTVKHHLISDQVPPMVDPDLAEKFDLHGRVMVVRKAQVVPFECVIRGYLEGSGWAEYQKSSSVCGIALPGGLKQCDRLTQPIFTPATKAESGHDENVSFDYLVSSVGAKLAGDLRDKSLSIYDQGARLAASKGILIADTKFEWGWHENELILIDEVLTPDSSRFWPADLYSPGKSQQSFDKQFVREWLMGCGWDRNSPPPPLPEEITLKTREKYLEALERISGQKLDA